MAVLGRFPRKVEVNLQGSNVNVERHQWKDNNFWSAKQYVKPKLPKSEVKASERAIKVL